jgi:hypothetical protein
MGEQPYFNVKTGHHAHSTEEDMEVQKANSFLFSSDLALLTYFTSEFFHILRCGRWEQLPPWGVSEDRE